MRARGRWLRGGLVGLVGVALLGAAWAGLGATDELPDVGFDAETARYFNLPDGKAQIGVSRVDGQYLTVRWREPDGKTWTDPKTVYDAGGDRMYDFMRIRVAGPTLALLAIFRPIPDSDKEFEGWPPGVGTTVFVVCRDGSCTTSREYDGTLYTAPQITPDGEHVFLAQRGDVSVTWDGDQIEEQRATGLPEGDYGENQPLLTPDGSLRAVQGVAEPGGCEFTLLATQPGEVAYREALTHQDAGDRRKKCTSTLESFASDYVVVVGRSKYRPWFASATEAGWRTVTEDPSGQVRYPRTGHADVPAKFEIAGRFELRGYWHWSRVLATSPDGRTLVVQVHRPGEERWGPPQVVARAPRGSQCIYIDPMPTYTDGEEDPFYINLRCRSRPAPGAEWVYSYPTAVTDDGTHWHSFLAVESGLRVGDDMVFRGNPTYRWTPEGGLRRVDLPLPRGAVISLLSNGSYALSRLMMSGSGCDVQVQLAGSEDKA